MSALPGALVSLAAVLRRLDVRGMPSSDLIAALPRPETRNDGEEERLATVRGIIEQVRSEGDGALRRLNERFDGRLGPLRVPAEAMRAAYEATDPVTVEALKTAARRIRDFHETQLHPPTIYETDGVSIRSFTKPVGRVGCYVPGGRAAYPSSLLMTALPALVVGVPEVVVCVPADSSTGEVAPVVLAAAVVAGVDEVYALGGAQAIAAMAYGTESVQPVDVICGPGNSFVALAKREVAGVVGIASAYAGPSEIVVIADDDAPARFVAVDLMVQAEHGPDGLAWLVTTDPLVADAVDRELSALLATAPRSADIEATLSSAGYAVVVDDLSTAVAVSNAIAPEHLQLMCRDAEAVAAGVENVGAIFCGPWRPPRSATTRPVPATCCPPTAPHGSRACSP